MSVVNGTVRQISNATRSTSVRFVSYQKPVVIDNAAVVEPSEIYARTNAAGFFSVTLAYGSYEMFVGSARLLIEVPNDAATYNFSALVVSQGVYEPTLPAGSVPDATQSVPGKVRVDTSVGDPVAVTGIFYISTTAGGDWAAAIRALPNKANNKVAFLRRIAGEDRPEQLGWDAASTATDDGYSVIKPSDTDAGAPGRWLQHG